MGVFSEKEAQGFIKSIQDVAKNEVKGATENYQKVISEKVIDESG